MKTGVIGLGAMGSGMARNLHRAGHLHRVWNRTRSRAEAITDETGVPTAGSIAELAAGCELILTCVSQDRDLMEVVEAIAADVTSGSIVADTSTVSSDTAKQAAALLAQAGAGFLDCPVSGGVEGADKGTLSVMAGGEQATLERARDTLSAIAATIVYIGDTGSGQACKAVNQVMCAGINQAVTEALAFGEVMQLDMERVLQVVSRGAAGNWFLDHRGHTMLAGSYDRGFKVQLHHKDLGICLQMAAQRPGTGLPLTEQTLLDYERLMQQGHGDEDISSLYRLKRQ